MPRNVDSLTVAAVEGVWSLRCFHSYFRGIYAKHIITITKKAWLSSRKVFLFPFGHYLGKGVEQTDIYLIGIENDVKRF